MSDLGNCVGMDGEELQDPHHDVDHETDEAQDPKILTFVCSSHEGRGGRTHRGPPSGGCGSCVYLEVNPV